MADDPETECAPLDEIDSLAKEVTVDIFIKNRYFDSAEFNLNPIKTYVQYYY